MTFLCAILLAAMSRAEFIARFNAAPVVQASGLVQVRAECGADMRREFQLPVAGFVTDIVRRLYAAEKIRERRFEKPGIVVVIGDVITNLTNVVVRPMTRDDGTKWTKVLVPAPGFADAGAMRLATIQGFYRAVKGEELDAAAAIARFRAAVPELRLEDEYRAIAEWQDGRRGGEDDEKFLKLMRSVLNPGFASADDLLVFASRLYLYPEYLDQPFCGRFDCVSFREAIALSKIDPRIRFAAMLKMRDLTLYGCGRGEKMNAAVAAYVAFLKDLMEYTKSEAELVKTLDAADAQLKGVLE